MCFATFPVLVGAGAGDIETVVTDRSGVLQALMVDGDYVPVQCALRVPTKGWSRFLSLADARDLKCDAGPAGRVWTGSIEIAPGAVYRVEQSVREVVGGMEAAFRVTAEGQADVEGVYVFLSIPLSEFRGGHAALSTAEDSKEATLPVDKPDEPRFLVAEGKQVHAGSPSGDLQLDVSLSRSAPMTVQDGREWGGTQYDVLVPIHLGPVPAGETVELTLTLTLTGTSDHSSAALTVDPGSDLGLLDGFGGNYCFGIESPVTDYTLGHLKVAWARTEMTLSEWEPENDNDSPDEVNWDYLNQQDTPGSNLRREFELARRIQDKGIPYCISVWHLPQWLYEGGGRSQGDSGRPLKAGAWPELVECVCSYLQYAKEQYGVEPDLFSFNEANIGVYLLLTAEEHQQCIRMLGARCERLGLKTKMLLGDVHAARGTIEFVRPAAADPGAMKYVGALAFHSWGGASPDEYRAWGDLARKLDLPLLVTELGVDAAAWRTSAYDSYQYMMREAAMYQELLLYARARGTMQWEFTNDYSIVAQRDAALEPTLRFNLVRHFCNLTPLPGKLLDTTSDNPSVLVTAVAGEVGALAVHIVNSGPARTATIAGLSSVQGRLRRVLTSQEAGFSDEGSVEVTNGVASIDLPAQSVTTLTTVPQEAW